MAFICDKKSEGCPPNKGFVVFTLLVTQNTQYSCSCLVVNNVLNEYFVYCSFVVAFDTLFDLLAGEREAVESIVS